MNKILALITVAIGKADKIHAVVTGVYNAWNIVYDLLQKVRQTSVDAVLNEDPKPAPAPDESSAAPAASVELSLS